MASAPPARWDLVEEHLDEAAFLLQLWEEALRSPDYSLAEIAAGPEERLLAHLDGVVLAGRGAAEKLLVPALAGEERGPVFAAAFALLASEEGDFTGAVLEALGKAEPEARGGLRRALATVPRPDLGPKLAALVPGAAPPFQDDLLEVLLALGADPGVRLEPLCASRDPAREALALRLARRFPARLDPAAVERGLGSPDAAVRAAALETGAVLGLRPALAAAEAEVAARGPAFAAAALLLGLGGEERAVAALLPALGEAPVRRAAAFALGFSGRISAADALLAAMGDEELAPLAAEGFAAISGLQVARRFARPPPRWDPEAPEPEEPEAYGPEADLPRPEPEAVAAWWKEARPRLDPARRWLRGQPWGAAAALRELEEGPARRRQVLALDLAVRTRGAQQVTWDAPSARQRAELLAARGGAPAQRPAPARGAPPEALAVTGLGLATSLGGLVSTCAAMRCGLARPAPLTGPVALDTEALEPVPATGHPVPGLDGFEGVARYVKLAAAALRDLRLGSGAPPSGGTALALCLSRARPADWDFFDDLLAEALPGRAFAAAGLPPPATGTALLAGHTAAVAGLAWARAVLRRGEAARVLLLAVDTLVTGEVLGALAEAGRLKSDEAPTGLMPGEAGAALLLEPARAARARGVPVRAVVEAEHLEPAPGDPGDAVAGARALARALAAAWPAGLPLSALVGDLNGESDRAMRWGTAQTILVRDHDLAAPRLLLPAVSLGDTGAASGLVAIAAAVRGFERGTIQDGRAVLWSCADDGGAGAARLSAG